jgi:hypothetical protein
MRSTTIRGVFLAALVGAVSVPASAGELKLSMQNGRVTLIADNVPIRQILQEWARVGQTKVVNAEKVSGPNLTLQLIDTPERDALDIILRSVTGYIAAPRTTPMANAAVYDRITIFMSTTRPPAVVASAAPPPTFQRPPQPQGEEGDEPIGIQMPQPMTPNGAMPMVSGQQPMPMPAAPGMLMQGQQQLPVQQQLPSPMNAPITAPRPGALPQPTTQPVNPYQPGIRPGGGGPGGPGGPER